MLHSSRKTAQRQKFTKKEDAQLIRLVKKYGTSSWERIAEKMERRNGRQCRDRYNNHLLQNFKKGMWTNEEDDIIIQMYFNIGPQWSKISKLLDGRSGNDVKNRWHKKLYKRIDSSPDEHIPTDFQADIQTEVAKKLDHIIKLEDELKNKEVTDQNQQHNPEKNLFQIFKLYEQTGQTWNMFPSRSEEKKLW